MILQTRKFIQKQLMLTSSARYKLVRNNYSETGTKGIKRSACFALSRVRQQRRLNTQNSLQNKLSKSFFPKKREDIQLTVHSYIDWKCIVR